MSSNFSKRWLAAVFVPGLLLSTGCGIYPYRAEVDFHGTAEFKGIQRVAVETRNGRLTIRCLADATDVDIQAVRYAQGITPDEAQLQAESIEIETARDATDPGLLRIVARFPPHELGRNMGARINVTLPPRAALDLRTSNGPIEVSGAGASVDAKTSNGRVIVLDSTGDLAVRTSNGRVVARNVAGNIDVETSNGNVELEKIGDQTIRAVTHNGRIRARQTTGQAMLRTSNGSVELYAISVPEEPNIEVVTSNGRITVKTPSTVRARLKMQTSNGRVTANLKGAEISELDAGRSHLEATLNDGGGRIVLRSSNSSIAFHTTDGTP